MNEKLIKIADCLEELAELLREPIFPMQDAPEKEPVSVRANEAASGTDDGGATADIKLEDVRAVLADLSRKGHTKEMKQILSQFGAERLSDVPKEKYAALLSAAKEAANA